jgi:hypothetical protein
MTGPLTAPSATINGGTIDNTVIGASTPAAASFTSLNGGQLAGMRNLVINGDMRIDQRNNGAAVTPASASVSYIIDRWQASVTPGGKWTFQQVASTTAGSAYAFKSSVASAYTAVAGDYFLLSQCIEALNIAHLNWGTANAKPITISGILNCSVTGSYAICVRNNGGTRSYVALVSVATANTDTPFAVTVPGDTAGTWTTDTSVGIRLSVDLGSGSSWNGAAANTWSGNNVWRLAASVILTGTAGASVILKDVQVEAGSVATPFERRPIGTELNLCQRYYGGSVIFSGAYVSSIGGGVYGSGNLHAQMRSAPSTITIAANSSSNVSGLTVGALGQDGLYAYGTATAVGNATLNLTLAANAEL